MKLTVSQLKYMLVLGNFSEGRIVRTVDIAKSLNIKRSSAFNMLNRLSEAGMVIKNEDKTVILTQKGRKTADSLRIKVGETARKLEENFYMASDISEDCALMIISCSEEIDA